MDGRVGRRMDETFQNPSYSKKDLYPSLIHSLSVCQVPRPGTSRGDLDRVPALSAFWSGEGDKQRN